MDSQKVDMFLMSNNKYFESYQLPQIRERLNAASDEQWQNLQLAQFKDPTTSILISIFAGNLGIDRFYIGDTGLGIAKLLTCGGLGIWAIVDWFLIMGRTRELNGEKLSQYI